ncbi:MAG: hypothetical protein NTZ47_14035, partial [Bacteroidetes bacterium]|nr:hypothetical protein [Bacteroidota bacterium]
QRALNSKSYIPLVMENIPAGKYTLQLTHLVLKSENKLYFIDNYTQQMNLLQQDTIFQFDINSDSLSISRTRFLITGKDPLQSSHYWKRPITKQPSVVINLSAYYLAGSSQGLSANQMQCMA